MSTNKKNSIFSTLYCSRIMVTKDGATIVNLSLIFGVIALLTAPWLVIGGAIAAMALGYKFGYIRNAEGFCGDMDAVVRDAKTNLRNVVDNVTDNNQQS